MNAAPPAQIAPLAADVVAALQSRLVDYPGGVIVVGRADGRVVRIDVVRGATAPDATGDTPFEVGSITKTVTGVLLADAIRRGEVGESEPIDELLPDGVTAPSRDGAQITLGELATQRSGLPRMAFNWPDSDPRDPYSNYDTNAMFDFLEHYTLLRAPGSQYEYSNYGFGLLGTLLADRAQMPYATLARDRVFAPLGLQNTAADASLDARLLPEFDGDDDPQTPWHFNAIVPAGQMRSSANDLLRFAAAAFPDAKGPVADDQRAAIAPHADIPGGQIGYAWMISGRSGIVWHNGGTGGAYSWLGMVPAQRQAVVLLSNVGLFFSMPLDDVGIHLLNPQAPLVTYTHPTVPPAVLQRYVGRYHLTGGTVLDVGLDQRGLTAQLPGQPRIRLWPDSPTQFSARQAPATIDFTLTNGRVTGATLHQEGTDVPLTRITLHQPQDDNR